jgi:hypothetical protein
MKNDKLSTTIHEEDLSFLADRLSQTNKALSLHNLAETLAYKKTASQLSREVKKYDPNCEYEPGDLIYKEYNEPLTVSSKGAEHFKGSVVLQVLNKTTYENFKCEMLEVEYSGGGMFRRHVDYMKKTNTQVLLPSNLENKARKPEALKKEEDPRLTQLPMTDKEFKTLERNLGNALQKSDIFFRWNDLWQLKKNQISIPAKKIKEMEAHFLETGKSMSTQDLVTQIFGVDSSSELHDLHCLSLNHFLEKKQKKNFVHVSPHGWGKWHLKKITDSMKDGLPIAAKKAKLPPIQDEKQAAKTESHDFPLKLYLSWREVLSGALQIPKSLDRKLAKSREYIFEDIEGEKEYTVYYFPSSCYFLGLKEFYEIHNVPQGSSLTLEWKEPARFCFWLKKSKKKLSVPKVSYDLKADKLIDTDEDVFTFSLPNKIIYIENDTLKSLFSLYSQRGNKDLLELLILVFKNFGLEGETLFLHSLKAFQLVDILKHTTVEDVEHVLLNSEEFSPSEKKKGLFFYTEKTKEEEVEEEAVEILPEMPTLAEIEGEALPEIGSIEDEFPSPEEVEEEEIEEIIELEEKPELPAPPPEPLDKAIEEKPKKEKPPRKKKERARAEVEVGPRKVKRVKKHIEERIELEESEQEAFIAVKADKKREPEEERAAVPEKEAKEEFKPPVSEQPAFGIFAEKLKSALDLKDIEKKKKSKTPEKQKKQPRKKAGEKNK